MTRSNMIAIVIVCSLFAVAGADALPAVLEPSTRGVAPEIPVVPVDDAYAAARGMIIAGEWDEAATFLRQAVADDPANAALHLLSAEVSFYYYTDRGQLEALADVAQHAKRAVEIDLAMHEVNRRAVELLADASAAADDPAALEVLFEQAAALEKSGLIELAHARALVHLGSTSAEELFRRAAALSSEGNTAALEEFGEWLLDRNRAEEVIELLAPSDTTAANPYLNFLRGVALERSGYEEEAAAEYDRYSDLSAVYPAPSRYRIPGSILQEQSGIEFASGGGARHAESIRVFGSTEVVPLAITSSKAQKGLSFLIYGEAGGESIGGKRAEGWVVRNRVLRGSVYNSNGEACPYVKNGGSTLADQYKTVMCQGDGAQFNGVCLAWCSKPDTGTCKETGETAAVASDVYTGRAPDPVGNHCPGGFDVSGSLCSSSTRCKGNTSTYRLAGGLFNYGISKACPGLCASGQGKVCGNGGSDNCFYSNTRYARGTVNTFGGSLASGECGTTAEFTANKGTHSGHLEGTENSRNPDFQLYLQKSCGSNCWTNVAVSSRTGTVEDINFTNPSSAKFRWRVCSASGSGDWKLYTRRP